MSRLDAPGGLGMLALLITTLFVTSAAAQTTRPGASTPATRSAGAERTARLTAEIRQRDSAERRTAAVAEARAMLKGDAASQATALAALAAAAEVKFDRTGLEAEIAKLLASPSAEVRRAALVALPTVKPDGSRIEEVARLAGDPDPGVRATVMQAIVAIRRAARVDTPVGEPALMLLADPQKEVVVETARGLWGVPLTAEVEAKAIELSRFGEGEVPSHKSIPYWMNYLVLSTRPRVSKPVAERLAEIARHPLLDQNWTGRAVWGLAHGSAPEAADVVTKALIGEIDHSTSAYNREWAVRGLAALRTDAARKKLEEVAAKDESDELRRLASNAVATPSPERPRQ